MIKTQKERKRDRDIEREREIQRHRERETEREETETGRERERERKRRERERDAGEGTNKTSFTGDDYDLQIIDEIEESKQELNYYFLNPKKEVTCWIRNTTCYNYGGLYSTWNMYIRNYSDVNVEVREDGYA